MLKCQTRCQFKKFDFTFLKKTKSAFQHTKMPIGLFTNPLQMIFSLLLMQGISLTMFRAFLNQAITRSDPMRFSLNLGNTNNASGSSNLINGVPTPSPIVDPRVMDLLTLIKALTPANGAANQAVASAPPLTQVAAPAHFMSAPLILASSNQANSQQQYIGQPVIAQTAPLVHHVAPNTQIPQIIIIPSLKASSSEQVAVKVPPNSSLSKPEEKQSKSKDDQVAKQDLDTSEENNNDSLTINFSNKRKSLLKSVKNKQNNDVIIFEAVGVNFRHPNHNYDKDKNKEMHVIEIDNSR